MQTEKRFSKSVKLIIYISQFLAYNHNILEHIFREEFFGRHYNGNGHEL